MSPDQPRSKRLAAAFVLIGLALSAIGLAYIIYAGRERKVFPETVPDNLARLQHVKALFRMLLHFFLIFLTFVFGSYLMVRIGRALSRAKPGAGRTAYVDAWSNYRLTQEELDTATARLEEDFPPDGPSTTPEP